MWKIFLVKVEKTTNFFDFERVYMYDKEEVETFEAEFVEKDLASLNVELGEWYFDETNKLFDVKYRFDIREK